MTLLRAVYFDPLKMVSPSANSCEFLFHDLGHAPEQFDTKKRPVMENDRVLHFFVSISTGLSNNNSLTMESSCKHFAGWKI